MDGEAKDERNSDSGGRDENAVERWAEEFREKQRIKYENYHEEKYERNAKRIAQGYKASGTTFFIGIVAVAAVIAAVLIMLS